MKLKLKRSKYRVVVDADDIESRTYINKNKAYQEFISQEALSPNSDTIVILEEIPVIYEIEIDEEDFEYFFDSNPDNITTEDIEELEIIDEEEGEPKEIGTRTLPGYEKKVTDIREEIRTYIELKYGWDGIDYHTIPGTSIKIRLKDHTANQLRMDENTLSIVIADNNPTARKFRKTLNEISFTSSDDIDYIKNEIDERIEYLKEKLGDE